MLFPLGKIPETTKSRIYYVVSNISRLPIYSAVLLRICAIGDCLSRTPSRSRLQFN
jgi:hypothetical protein